MGGVRFCVGTFGGLFSLIITSILIFSLTNYNSGRRSGGFDTGLGNARVTVACICGNSGILGRSSRAGVRFTSVNTAAGRSTTGALRPLDTGCGGVTNIRRGLACASACTRRGIAVSVRGISFGTLRNVSKVGISTRSTGGNVAVTRVRLIVGTTNFGRIGWSINNRTLGVATGFLTFFRVLTHYRSARGVAWGLVTTFTRIFVVQYTRRHYGFQRQGTRLLFNRSDRGIVNFRQGHSTWFFRRSIIVGTAFQLRYQDELVLTTFFVGRTVRR